MIEKMKMVGIVSSASRKDEMLEGLRSLGLVHLAEKKSPSRAAIERFDSLSRTSNALLDYAPDKKSGKAANTPILSDEEFEKMYQGVLAALDRKEALEQKISADNTEIDRISEWGNFSPEELKGLKDAGYDIHFYRIEVDEYKKAAEDPDIKLISLAPVNKQLAVAVLGALPQDYTAQEFSLPEKSISEFEEEIAESRKEITACEEVFKDAAIYGESFKVQMLKAQNDENYSSASETAESDDELVWICGYIPECDLSKLEKAAAENNWAWIVDDVSDDDEQIPTKMKYGKISGLIGPVMDILGILPGYREPDISLWFMLFFTLFFAMIIGDAGYGMLILVGTLGYTLKTRKSSTATYLLYVLSIATIIWGAITGTWFGMESAMKVPFLKALVIPNFANYPEYFDGITSTITQNTVMKFSFTLGAVQMSLGTLISIKRKMAAKDITWLTDLGWLINIIAMYLMALYLVIGDDLPVNMIFAMIAVGFTLVVCFGGMSPDKTFLQGLLAGLANAFTEFLNTISCFGNVMSYIRLFAVGMAGLAIAQSFNEMAAGFKGPLIIFAVVIVIIGHVMNIVMAFLSVVVHGVRLNVMEFSGQAGVEWTGIAYEPFKLNDKIKK